jgi:signal transduction histidine kinase
VLEGNLRAALDHVYELDDEQIANLYEQTRHLIRLVNELRELTLAEAAQLPLAQEMVDLNALVQESAAVFEPLMEEKSVQLLVQLPPQRAAVNVDRSRIRQVLHNLLANALRHTPSGGQVTIAVAQPAGRLRLTVQDTGEGIAPENLEHIFDRFYRTDPSRSRETGGSGLGLAIVKAIVEAHGGEVTASSGGVGRGTRFTIFLAVG